MVSLRIYCRQSRIGEHDAPAHSEISVLGADSIQRALQIGLALGALERYFKKRGS